MKLRVLTYALILLAQVIPDAGMAQYFSMNPGFSPFTGVNTSFRVDSAGNVTFIPGKTSYQLNMGASFTTNFGGDGIFNTYVAPEFSHNISKRFRLTGGIAISKSFGPSIIDHPMRPYYGYGPGMRSTVFASGQYLINNKLSLTGTVYKDFSISEPAVDPRFKMPDRHGMILDLNYRPVKNMQINAIIQVHQGGWDPWGYPGYSGSPWGRYDDPFMRGAW